MKSFRSFTDGFSIPSPMFTESVGELPQVTPTPQEVLQACLAYIQAHAKSMHTERAVIIDLRSGERMLDQFGSADEVVFDPKVFHGRAPLALIHNHPAGLPFSTDDFILFATQATIQDMYVVSTKGTWQIHKTEHFTWKTLTAAEIRQRYQTHLEAYGAQYDFAESSIPEAMHAAIRGLATDYGASYTKVA